mmetsp:Transcript_10068/g.30752  ORF Transcript_10068/g.30752 Transcript_10068/m.30752 type:complete len:201 (+) Transcript_10068:201-803(+)
MGNEASSVSTEGERHGPSSVYTVIPGVAPSSAAEGKPSAGLSRLRSLPEVRPLLDGRDGGGDDEALLPGLLATLLPVPSAQPRRRVGDELEHAMQGLALPSRNEELAERQERIVEAVRSVSKQLQQIRLCEEDVAKRTAGASRKLEDVDRMLLTVADINGEIEDIAATLAQVTSRLPPDDPLHSFGSYLASLEHPARPAE